jgi:hypothetical protein
LLDGATEGEWTSQWLPMLVVAVRVSSTGLMSRPLSSCMQCPALNSSAPWGVPFD